MVMVYHPGFAGYRPTTAANRVALCTLLAYFSDGNTSLLRRGWRDAGGIEPIAR